MPGENVHLTPLESRKQLLLLESELNRAQLLNEVHDLKNEIHRLKDQLHAIGSVASSAAKLADTVSAIGRAFSHREEGDKASWISRLLNGAKTGTSLWLLLRSCWRKA